MAVNHVIRRGDSLYGLAGRYLGNFNCWPEIYAFHNEQVKLRGASSKALIAIKDPNLIYVGQVLVIPGRGQHPKGKVTPPAGVGNAMPKRGAIPIDLKVEYKIGKDTPPISYVEITNEYTIELEMTGKIAIEMVSINCHQHNYDLLMCSNLQQAKTKLSEKYNPALAALVAKPKMTFEMDRVSVCTPMATNANSSHYEIKVSKTELDQSAGMLGPFAVSGVLQIEKIEYRYYAEITFKAEVCKKTTTKPNAEGNGLEAVLKGAVFGFKASGVVIKETTKIVAIDVALALTNYIPLSEGVSFWFGRGLSGWVINNNFAGMNQTAVRISLEIQSISDETFKVSK